MKQSLIAIILPVIALLTANAGEPKITWIETDHDFGAIAESDGRAECSFGYVNTGSEPLVVTAVRATCGCTTPRYSADALMPGDTAWINVAYDASGRPGRFEKKIYVTTNTDPAKSTLVIRGTVIGSPQTLRARFPFDAGLMRLSQMAMMIGEVDKGKIKSVFLDGYNASSDTLRPRFVNTPDWLQVSTTPREVAPGEQASFNFFLRTDRCKDYGLVTDSITFIPDDRHPELAVAYPVAFIAREDFSRLTPGQREKAPKAVLDADRVDLGLDVEALPVNTTLKLTNRGASTLHVRRIYTADPGVSATIDRREVKKGKSAVIGITLTPEAATSDGMINAKLQLITDDPDNPVQTIRIVGITKAH